MSEAPSHPWLPEGKRAAVCFSIDDVHPATSDDRYEAGGDLAAGALGHLEWLLERHRNLAATLFVTPDWREISPVVSRRFVARIPLVRNHVFLAPRWPAGRMRLSRHPGFCRYVASLPRTEVGLHGLHHVHPGPRIHVEFQQETRQRCVVVLKEALRIFEEAGLIQPVGMTPPGFEASAELIGAMADLGFTYLSSARDIRSTVTGDSKANMSGLQGVSLIEPEVLDGGLVHLPVNFQATNSMDRAQAILSLGGMLHVKAHIIKNCLGFIALDGLDELYRNYLDTLFTILDQRYGDSLWWATLSDVAHAVRNVREEQRSLA